MGEDLKILPFFLNSPLFEQYFLTKSKVSKYFQSFDVYDSLRLFTVKATPKLPALYVMKDWTIYMGMDTSATGVHKNLSSLTLEPCELLGFNIGEIQRSGPSLGFSLGPFSLLFPVKTLERID
jgi:hypothetical protein